ncbi:ester cyclase [Dyella lutea]|uniref:Ester cyclase n=1 Tax=Dyella lutea TaxID=2950441 RepID=A0ABT1FCM0_9GAMM|nr:ester cyclase [Dyella lutea]MCP1375121.1 ester cyclase [Dyella lutea]
MNKPLSIIAQLAMLGALGTASTQSVAAPARPAHAAVAATTQGDSVASHIATFDELDFDVFTHQKWNRLKESHAPDIVVHWPDGHVTHGIEQHIKDLQAMFVYAPDTRISAHPIKFGEGPWTSVVGVLQGTFTRPMPIGHGKFIPPTGRAFKLEMVTIGHWKGATMDEEYLFWDNATFMKQLGVGS